MWLDATIYIRMVMIQHTEFTMNTKREVYEAAVKTLHAKQEAYEVACRGHHNLLEQQETASHACTAWKLATEARTALALKEAGLEGEAAHATFILARAFGHGWATEPEDVENHQTGIPGPRVDERWVVHTTGGGSLTWHIVMKDGEVIFTNDFIHSIDVRCWKAVNGKWVASGTIPLDVIQTKEPMGYRLPRIREALKTAVTSLCGHEEWERLVRFNEEFGQ